MRTIHSVQYIWLCIYVRTLYARRYVCNKQIHMQFLYFTAVCFLDRHKVNMQPVWDGFTN